MAEASAFLLSCPSVCHRRNHAGEVFDSFPCLGNHRADELHRGAASGFLELFTWSDAVTTEARRARTIDLEAHESQVADAYLAGFEAGRRARADA